MSLPSRLLSGAVLTAVLATGLAGCGNDPAKDAATRAHTRACRAYVLVGGADAEHLAKDLQGVVEATGTFNAEDVVAGVAAVRAAATRAGLTDDLPAKDFRVFATLVDAAVQAQTAVQGDGDLGNQAAAVATYTRAVKAVDARCA